MSGDLKSGDDITFFKNSKIKKSGHTFMYIWLDFISKTGHVTYYYIPTNFSQKLSPKKRDKNKLRRHITDPSSPPPRRQT